MKSVWTPSEKKLLANLDTPLKIQNYINSLAYNPANATLSPRYVMLSEDAHCLEGALLAAAALEYHGYAPRLVNLQAHRDDHHIITVYKGKTGWGSIGKSNTTLLRGRLPHYKSVRELVMSYFDFYFNVNHQPSLYAYSDPIRLDSISRDWRTSEKNLEELGIEISQLTHFEILSLRELEKLPKASESVVNACFLGADAAGLFRP